MKAPARMASISIERSGSRALTTPTSSTLRAISFGEKASKPKTSDIAFLSGWRTGYVVEIFNADCTVEPFAPDGKHRCQPDWPDEQHRKKHQDGKGQITWH